MILTLGSRYYGQTIKLELLAHLLTDRQFGARLGGKLLQFESSSWRETFAKLNSNPRLGGKLLQS